MQLESKWTERIKDKLIRSGYGSIERGLVVFGGKDNGTVDLKATNNKEESIVIEIKNHPVHLLDLSHFLTLKKNIESKLQNKKMKFILITCEQKVSKPIIEIAESKGIEIQSFEEFIDTDV